MMGYFAGFNTEEEEIRNRYVLIYSPLLSSYSIVTLGYYIKLPQQTILIAIAKHFSEIKKIKNHKQQQQIKQANEQRKFTPPPPAT